MVSAQTEDIEDLCRTFLDVGFTAAMMTRRLSYYDLRNWTEECDEALTETFATLGDTIDIVFEVQNNLVRKISCEVFVDMNAAYADYWNTSEAVDPSSQAYVNVSAAFVDPEDASHGMNFDLKISDGNRNELGSASLDYEKEQNGTIETGSIYLEVTEDEEIIYSGTPYTMSYDSASGDLDMVLSYSSDETISLVLDGTFAWVENGNAFTMDIDTLSLEFGDTYGYREKIGLEGELSLSAEPSIEVSFGQQAGIFEMTTEELDAAMQEIIARASVLVMMMEQAGFGL